jgi:hypothetical protein
MLSDSVQCYNRACVIQQSRGLALAYAGTAMALAGPGDTACDEPEDVPVDSGGSTAHGWQPLSQAEFESQIEKRNFLLHTSFCRLLYSSDKPTFSTICLTGAPRRRGPQIAGNSADFRPDHLGLDDVGRRRAGRVHFSDASLSESRAPVYSVVGYIMVAMPLACSACSLICRRLGGIAIKVVSQQPSGGR